MIRSIRGRLTLVLVLLLSAGLVFVSVGSVVLVRRYLSERVGSSLATVASRVTAGLAGQTGYELDVAQLQLLIPVGNTAVLVDTGGQVVLTLGTGRADAGTLVAAAAGLTAGHTRVIERPEPMVVALIDTPGLVVDRVTPAGTVHAERMVVAAPVAGDRGTVRLITLVTTSGTLIAITLMGLLASLLIRVGLRPLTRMAHTADAIAAGHRDLRLPVGGTGPETEKLAAAVNKAFDAQRRAEDRLRTFVADASHELRTPLATVNGWIDLYVQGGLRDPEQLDHAMVRVEAEVGRMRLLVDELSLLARLDAARPLARDEVDVVGLAAEVVDDARVVTADRGIELTGAARAPLHGDGPRLQQVLRNLVGNAVQHTRPGTPVTVSITVRPEHVDIEVRDEGDGIAPEHLAHVFERFYRADPSRSRDGVGSSGLGLAIVEAIVAAHGGTTGVTSAVGAGTTVRVTLPATRPPAAPDRSGTPARPVAPGPVR
ncbi:ATP-binding protein [Actinoplanes sp. NPDC051494]|uniref:sensor histidine kinase n=1 Tax=Actinoplanes sp. NPDC051494 TaxID=3363907 RepID=UPI00379D7DE3